MEFEIDALRRGDLDHQFYHFFHQGRRREGHAFQLEPFGLDLREVENIVEKVQELIARGANDLDVFTLLVRKGHVE